MKYLTTLIIVLAGNIASAQELYVFTEPASNMPSKSIGVKQSAKWLRNTFSGRTESRHTSEVMFGMNKNL
ncbi:MAG: hypothetical protein ACN4EP_11100, partial [Sediminibacterium sp.]